MSLKDCFTDSTVDDVSGQNRDVKEHSGPSSAATGAKHVKVNGVDVRGWSVICCPLEHALDAVTNLLFNRGKPYKKSKPTHRWLLFCAIFYETWSEPGVFPPIFKRWLIRQCGPTHIIVTLEITDPVKFGR